MADTSQMQMFFAEESTWATPASGTYNELRITGESISETQDFTDSEEIRSDRQLVDTQQTSVSAEGDIDFELTFDTFETLFEGALLNTFDGELNISGTDISADGTNDKFDSTSTDFSSVKAGQWINVGGFSNSANNGFFRIDSGTSNSLFVRNSSLTDESSGNQININGNRLVNGTTDKFFTFEKEFGDTGDFYRYPGSYISTMDLEIDSGSIITGTFGIMSEQEEHNESQTGSSTNAANTNPVTNATSNIDTILEGGKSSNLFVNSLSISYDNNLRERPAVGQVTTREFGTGTINLTGSIEAYFEDDNLYDKFLNNTESDISFRVKDDDGNVLIFTIPQLEYTDGEVLAESQNEDIFNSLDFTGYRNTSQSNKTLQIDKFPSSNVA